VGRAPRHELIAALALALASCSPSSVSDAEAQGNVKWLQQNGTPEAVSALGRLADKNPAALAALDARASYDGNVYVAAWSATLREAPWGPKVLRDGLADPTRAETAASKMDRFDVHAAAFVPDLEQALVRLSASTQNTSIARVLAGGTGAAATDAVKRRLADGATRSAMCRGIEAPDASMVAKKTLLAVPEASRDAPACVDAVVRIASADDDALTWLATAGEPGILGAAGKTDVLSCALVHNLWARALEARKPETYPALVVPLASAIRRCTVEMDGVLADALTRLPRTHAVVVNAIDPYDSYGQNLRATCAALGKVVASGDAPIIRERASDAREHGCVSR
jgi:hypothetical protein